VRTLATIWTTLCAAFVSLGAVAAVGACSSGGAQQNAGDKRGEVNAMNDNSTNRVEAGATSSDNSATRNANDARTDATTDASAQKSQLDLKTSIRRAAGGDIVVEYSVTNRGARAVLLLNRGDTSLGLGPGRVYVEPQADGTVDLTQRGYTLPQGYGGPGPSVLTYPGVSALAPGKTARETLRVRAPKGRQHPYGRYYPEVQMPDPPRRVRFCLGVVAGDAPTKMTRGTRVLTSLQAVAAQELLCGEIQELN
jgi:hypothetical protein